MREAVCDAWDYAATNNVDAVCVLTNMTTRFGKLIMGAGQAQEAQARFPELPALWGEYYDTRSGLSDGYGPSVIWTPKSAVNNPDFALVSFPTKTDPRFPSKLSLIERSARELVAQVGDSHNIVLPRPGCGLGGLRWVDVKPVLQQYLDNRFVVITFAPKDRA